MSKTQQTLTVATACTSTVAPAAAPVATLPVVDARPHYCPTCLVPEGSTPELGLGVDGHAGVVAATCPECGIASVDYALVAELDAALDAAARLEALDAALWFAA